MSFQPNEFERTFGIFRFPKPLFQSTNSFPYHQDKQKKPRKDNNCLNGASAESYKWWFLMSQYKKTSLPCQSDSGVLSRISRVESYHIG